MLDRCYNPLRVVQALGMDAMFANSETMPS
jgi:hypothetical protein